MNRLSAYTEDYLECLYMREVEGTAIDLPTQEEDRVLGELLRHKYIQQKRDAVVLTKEGTRAAEMAVRRHRLAERLMHDVLDVHGRQVDAAACEFEHSLHDGVDERICILLGHPTSCPHGRPIPPGKCCREHRNAATPAIASLAIMKSGDHGQIAYLSSRQSETVQKLMALGVLPGSTITVVQTFPSVVFQVGQTQLAVDAALAGDIYVRRGQ